MLKKRILGILLTLAMVLSMATPAFAAEAADFRFLINISNWEADIGDTVQVKLVIASGDNSSYDIYTMQDYVGFDTELVEVDEDSIKVPEGFKATLQDDRIFVNRYGTSPFKASYRQVVLTFNVTVLAYGEVEFTHSVVEMVGENLSEYSVECVDATLVLHEVHDEPTPEPEPEPEPEETEPEPVETEPEETEPEETEPEETKPEETKPEETKPEETKPVETEPEETKEVPQFNINVEVKPVKPDVPADPSETDKPADPDAEPEEPKGSVEISHGEAGQGDKIKIEPKPDDGYEVVDIIVTDKDGNPVDVNYNEITGEFEFEMPDGEVNVSAVFGEETLFDINVPTKPSSTETTAPETDAPETDEAGETVAPPETTAPETDAPETDESGETVAPPETSAPETEPVEELKGTVTVDQTTAAKGDKIALDVKPDDGYEIADVIVTDENGNVLDVTYNAENDRYEFEMPKSAVNVQPVFVEAGTHYCPSEPYTDVDQSLWYHEAIDYVIGKRLMNGYSADLFAPGDTTNRAMIATILWRMAGSPVVKYAMPFTDVAEGTWYTEAVRWAAYRGIVKGVTETTFDPTAAITREQFAAMLYRYEQYRGLDVSASADYTLDFTDAADISDWAYDALAWCNMNKIVNGMGDGTVAPKGNATRAQAAQMLMNYKNR